MPKKYSRLLSVSIISYLLLLTTQSTPEKSYSARDGIWVDQFCFSESDTGTWILLYTEQGHYEILPGYNNTCWFRKQDLHFKTAAF